MYSTFSRIIYCNHTLSHKLTYFNENSCVFCYGCFCCRILFIIVCSRSRFYSFDKLLLNWNSVANCFSSNTYQFICLFDFFLYIYIVNDDDDDGWINLECVYIRLLKCFRSPIVVWTIFKLEIPTWNMLQPREVSFWVKKENHKLVSINHHQKQYRTHTYLFIFYKIGNWI